MTNIILSLAPELSMPADGETAFIIGVGGSLLVILMMAVISLIFILIGKVLSSDLRMKNTVADSASTAEPLKGKLPADTVAAISAAVYRYMEDETSEANTIITIDRAAKAYSPWSSKIYATHRNVFNSRRW